VTQTAQAIDRAFIDAFAERWHDAWNSHDPGRVAALCTADIVLEQSSSPTQHGRAGVEEVVRQLATAFGDFRFTPTEPPLLSADGRKAIAPWRMTGTMTGPLVPPGFAPTGQRLTLEGDDHWEFRDGLTSRCRTLFDANELTVQLGATPPPGSTGEKAGVLLQRLAARRLRARARKAAGTAQNSAADH
jgi:ketosteroid isomerase-like protein